jgi:hypothetical protein
MPPPLIGWQQEHGFHSSRSKVFLWEWQTKQLGDKLPRLSTVMIFGLTKLSSFICSAARKIQGKLVE